MRAIIPDNLFARTGADIRRWAKKNKVELRFTSTYASRANPVEGRFGPLRRFTLAQSNRPSHPAQTKALHRYLRWRKANGEAVKSCGGYLGQAAGSEELAGLV